MKKNAIFCFLFLLSITIGISNSARAVAVVGTTVGSWGTTALNDMKEREILRTVAPDAAEYIQSGGIEKSVLLTQVMESLRGDSQNHLIPGAHEMSDSELAFQILALTELQ